MQLNKTVRRTWRERLFSLTPWRATKKVRDYDAEKAVAERQRSWVATASGRGGIERLLDPGRRITPMRATPAPSPTFVGCTLGASGGDMTGFMFGAVAGYAISEAMQSKSDDAADEFKSGGGGDFGGAGASGSWDAPSPSPAPSPAYESAAPADASPAPSPSDPAGGD